MKTRTVITKSKSGHYAWSVWEVRDGKLYTRLGQKAYAYKLNKHEAQQAARDFTAALVAPIQPVEYVTETTLVHCCDTCSEYCPLDDNQCAECIAKAKFPEVANWRALSTEKLFELVAVTESTPTESLEAASARDERVSEYLDELVERGHGNWRSLLGAK